MWEHAYARTHPCTLYKEISFYSTLQPSGCPWWAPTACEQPPTELHPPSHAALDLHAYCTICFSSSEKALIFRTEFHQLLIDRPKATHCSYISSWAELRLGFQKCFFLLWENTAGQLRLRKPPSIYFHKAKHWCILNCSDVFHKGKKRNWKPVLYTWNERMLLGIAVSLTVRLLFFKQDHTSIGMLWKETTQIENWNAFMEL